MSCPYCHTTLSIEVVNVGPDAGTRKYHCSMCGWFFDTLEECPDIAFPIPCPDMYYLVEINIIKKEGTIYTTECVAAKKFHYKNIHIDTGILDELILTYSKLFNSEIKVKISEVA